MNPFPQLPLSIFSSTTAATFAGVGILRTTAAAQFPCVFWLFGCPGDDTDALMLENILPLDGGDGVKIVRGDSDLQADNNEKQIAKFGIRVIPLIILHAVDQRPPFWSDLVECLLEFSAIQSVHSFLVVFVCSELKI